MGRCRNCKCFIISCFRGTMCRRCARMRNIEDDAPVEDTYSAYDQRTPSFYSNEVNHYRRRHPGPSIIEVVADVHCWYDESGRIIERGGEQGTQSTPASGSKFEGAAYQKNNLEDRAERKEVSLDDAVVIVDHQRDNVAENRHTFLDTTTEMEPQLCARQRENTIVFLRHWGFSIDEALSYLRLTRNHKRSTSCETLKTGNNITSGDSNKLDWSISTRFLQEWGFSEEQIYEYVRLTTCDKELLKRTTSYTL